MKPSCGPDREAGTQLAVHSLTVGSNRQLAVGNKQANYKITANSELKTAN
jgi:hypothetical protein